MSNPVPKPPMILVNLFGTWTWLMRGDSLWYCPFFEDGFTSLEISPKHNNEVDREQSDKSALELYDSEIRKHGRG